MNLFRFTALLSLLLGCALTDSRAALVFGISESAFTTVSNSNVQFTKFAEGMTLPNPFTTTNHNGSIHVTESQVTNTSTIHVSNGSGVAFPNGEHYLNSNGGGPITLVFDQPLYGFAVSVESVFQNAGSFAITVYGGPTNDLVYLGEAHPLRTSGNHLTFLSVTDSAPEITYIVLEDSSKQLMHGHFALITNAVAPVIARPVLGVIKNPAFYDLVWSVTNPATFHVQFSTNLSLPAWQALSGSVSNSGPFYHQIASPAQLGKNAFFRLSTGSP